MEASSIEIVNTTKNEMIIVNEPYAFEFVLPVKEKISIEMMAGDNSVALHHTVQDGKICIQIWDDNYTYKVIHNGVDVFAMYFDE